MQSYLAITVIKVSIVICNKVEFAEQRCTCIKNPLSLSSFVNFFVKSFCTLLAVEKYYKTLSRFIRKNQHIFRQITVCVFQKVDFTEKFCGYSCVTIPFHNALHCEESIHFHLLFSRKFFVKSKIQWFPQSVAILKRETKNQ